MTICVSPLVTRKALKCSLYCNSILLHNFYFRCFMCSPQKQVQCIASICDKKTSKPATPFFNCSSLLLMNPIINICLNPEGLVYSLSK